MSWTVKDLKLSLKDIPDDAVIHLQINGHVTDRVTTIVYMPRPEIGIPALVLSPFVRRPDHYVMVDSKIIDITSNKDYLSEMEREVE